MPENHGGAAESSGKTAGRIPGSGSLKPDCQWKPGADGTSGFSDLYAEKLFQTDDSGGKPQAGADEPGAVYSGM